QLITQEPRSRPEQARLISQQLSASGRAPGAVVFLPMPLWSSALSAIVSSGAATSPRAVIIRRFGVFLEIILLIALRLSVPLGGPIMSRRSAVVALPRRSPVGPQLVSAPRVSVVAVTVFQFASVLAIYFCLLINFLLLRLVGHLIWWIRSWVGLLRVWLSRIGIGVRMRIRLLWHRVWWLSADFVAIPLYAVVIPRVVVVDDVVSILATDANGIAHADSQADTVGVDGGPEVNQGPAALDAIFFISALAFVLELLNVLPNPVKNLVDGINRLFVAVTVLHVLYHLFMLLLGISYGFSKVMGCPFPRRGLRGLLLGTLVITIDTKSSGQGLVTDAGIVVGEFRKDLEFLRSKLWSSRWV
ncbi:hypothetical protein QBC42DRAFT_311244, partial [Cladorrhinum samala]